MAYSKVRASEIKTSDIKYLPAGIQEDVVLKSARAEMSPNNNFFLEITFEKDGATLTHTEWEPVKGQFVVTDEQLQERQDKQFSRMLQILHCFYADEVLNFNGDSFKDFATWVASMLTAADKSKKLRVKVVYNNKGYTTLPNYAKYTFIEPMELKEGETSAIRILGIDNVVRPVVADTEVASTNPFDKPVETTAPENVNFGTPTSGENTNDLPF